MAFELSKVVPWGRTLEEYKTMFTLSTEDLKKSIASFGDGPASFNAEMTKLKNNVISFDPIYQFTKQQLINRIEETKDIVMKQTKENKDNFIWTNIKDLDELEKIRMGAMSNFIKDFEEGKEEKRYIPHELPNKTNFSDNHFDIGLSSHFLLLYPKLGLDFHIKSIDEMLRICKEVRIFPIIDLDAKESSVLQPIIDYYNKNYDVKIEKTDYEFQKDGDKVLVIGSKNEKLKY
ncbi:SAM-dependent methyltransferase [Clostridium gelidum]|uniref:SAM-dependent methyltransferase n=1 Tax=Clostridium gelidum TaxID=704125 RepID=A0ABM7T3L0_9CLOT|nr:SAM-dependent methyltransferase [Clostridium gelidum]BCZ46538.1 SAM-dependent methyltransferase [Clostridium gelidum]